ncbi:helix-turn-helix domain-containing protein [Clostridium kluyveri]|uniref:helix-turn-helix domain-containing protein n=1 Tax=Clostridium kluyveri TaxID=1534 RepID=UPI002247B6DB|nr:helix-turn-helix domain-containing protein [Clostridium kluyveri]UZQ48876.1 helix-turn-helix domain-containing protein [Clostridium kluyveri]
MRKNELLEQVYKSNLPSRAKQIMFYLINRSNSEGMCFPSTKTIASDCSISARTVQRTMTILLEEGFIKKDSRFREKGGQTSNLYTLYCPSKTSGGMEEKELNTKQEKTEDNCNEYSTKIETVTFADYISSNELVNEVIDKGLLEDSEQNQNDIIESFYRSVISCIPTECYSIFMQSERSNKGIYFKDNPTTVQCHWEGDNLHPP